jgi:hypothetical protein
MRDLSATSSVGEALRATNSVLNVGIVFAMVGVEKLVGAQGLLDFDMVSAKMQ